MYILFSHDVLSQKETGGHLKRYYNDDDLRAMLFYQPKLDQIKTRLAKLPPVPEAEKQSRDLSFLTHPLTGA